MKHFLAGAAVLLAVAVWATPERSRGIVVGVHDGYTITVALRPIWPWPRDVHIRMIGLDAPELDGACPWERAAAAAARDKLSQVIGRRVTLSGRRPDKYPSRELAVVRLSEGTDLAAMMIDAGLARPYFGGVRQNWCD